MIGSEYISGSPRRGEVQLECRRCHLTEETNEIPRWIRQISHQIIHDGSSWLTECPPKSVALFKQFLSASGISYSSDPLCQGHLRFDLRTSGADSEPDDVEYMFRKRFQKFLLQRYGAMNPSHCDGHLKLLHTGIPVPEYSITIPWHISRDSLFEYIPKDRFSFSFADWPMLTFSLFGVGREFAFNFATHPEELFYSIEYTDTDPDTYHVFRNRIEEQFGVPDRDFNRSTHWFDEQIVIDCIVCSSDPFTADAPVEFRFSICNSAHWPSHCKPS